MIGHFNDLNRAHEAVLKAKRQVELLSPLATDCERHSSLVSQVEDLRACREALRPYFAGLKLGLLEKRIAGLTDEWGRQDTQVRRIEELRDAQRAEEGELKRSIADNGGDRIERLAADIRSKDAGESPAICEAGTRRQRGPGRNRGRVSYAARPFLRIEQRVDGP